jgi:hypothetical protein
MASKIESSTSHTDPISSELKTVAIAIFGEKLAHRTGDGQVAVENVAGAIASQLWPDQSDEHKALRARFIRMCLNDVVMVDPSH